MANIISMQNGLYKVVITTSSMQEEGEVILLTEVDKVHNLLE